MHQIKMPGEVKGPEETNKADGADAGSVELKETDLDRVAGGGVQGESTDKPHSND